MSQATPARTQYYRPRLGRRVLAPRWWPTWLGVALLALGAWLPLALTRALGAGAGLLLAANAKRRRIARVNLRLCFPRLTEAERTRLLRRHFIVSGQAFVDLGLLAFGPRWRLRRVTRLRGLGAYRELAAQGRPLILLVPHLVGLNFGGTVLSAERQTFSMMKLQRNPVVNWLLNRGRMRFGAQLLAREQGLRPVIRGLREGLAFYYLPDEDFGPQQSVFAPFFGVPTATLPTLGRMAEMADAAVVPCFVRLRPWGRGYEVVLKPPLAGFPSGDRVADAAAMNRALEAGIREMPEQYMWTFKLFKTRPPGAPPLYPQKPKRRRR
jgi:lipid A biosynthesis lauroyl/palmitoleoyl acyltransferase